MKKFTLLNAEAIAATMTKPDRPIAFFAIVSGLAAIFLLAPAATMSPGLAAGVPPFCVMRGGSNGPGSEPQDCAYFGYQACLQAAADTRGNCVLNIDYHGEVSTVLAPARARYRSH